MKTLVCPKCGHTVYVGEWPAVIDLVPTTDPQTGKIVYVPREQAIEQIGTCCSVTYEPPSK